MEKKLQLMENPNVEGWGADLNPTDRPAYPKERTPPRFISPHWEEPEHQIQRVKVYKSTERPAMTPVFGTSVPPRGLSGKIRDLAYQYSENDLRRWLLLLFGDRVNMVEGVFSDLSRGHIPNIFAETGMRSELKFNRRGAFRKALVGLGLMGLVGYMVRRKRK